MKIHCYGMGSHPKAEGLRNIGRLRIGPGVAQAVRRRLELSTRGTNEWAFSELLCD